MHSSTALELVQMKGFKAEFICFMVNLPLNIGLNQSCGHGNNTIKSHTIKLCTLSLFAAFYLWAGSMGFVLVIAQLAKVRGRRGLRREDVFWNHFLRIRTSTRNGKHKLGGARQTPKVRRHI